MTSPIIRFTRFIDMSRRCWHWNGTRNNHGYGLFRPGGTSGKVLAHRFMWQLLHGPIPQGLCILHRCDNPTCVNPRHLFIGTKKDNTQDAVKKCRAYMPIALLECLQGHGRLRHRPSGGSWCPVCTRVQSRESYRRRHKVNPTQYRRLKSDNPDGTTVQDAPCPKSPA
jgi:hypothetical protein